MAISGDSNPNNSARSSRRTDTSIESEYDLEEASGVYYIRGHQEAPGLLCFGGNSGTDSTSTGPRSSNVSSQGNIASLSISAQQRLGYNTSNGFANIDTSSCSSSGSNSSSSSNSHHNARSKHWEAINKVKSLHGQVELKHFRKIREIGQGGSGTVYVAELMDTRTYFAVKVEDIDENNVARRRKEVQLMKLLDNPLLPTLFFHCEMDGKSYIVTEYCAAGDLDRLRCRQREKRFPEEIVRYYCAEILLALEYLHMLGIVYRDLKPENVLIKEDGHLMLTDFDLCQTFEVIPDVVNSTTCNHKKKTNSQGDVIPCKKCSKSSSPLLSFFSSLRHSKKGAKSKMKIEEGVEFVAEPYCGHSQSIVGTREYLAPEIIKLRGHGNAVDWWTFGIFLYELLYGFTPFVNGATVNSIVEEKLVFPEFPHVSKAAKDLISGLLVKNPEERIGHMRGAAEIKKHPFFEGIKWSLLLSRPPDVLPRPAGKIPMLEAISEEEEDW